MPTCSETRCRHCLCNVRKGLRTALAVIAGLSAAPRSAAAGDAPVAFIRALGSQAVSVIRIPDIPLATKAAYFDQMVRQDFDVTGICRFELGPYWRVATPAQQQQFCEGFADRLVRFYGQRLAQSGSGDFIVTGSRIGSDGVIVASRITPSKGAPITVIGGSGSTTAHTRSRTSPSTASAWRWLSAPRSLRSSRARAGSSGWCLRRCAQGVERGWPVICPKVQPCSRKWVRGSFSQPKICSRGLLAKTRKIGAIST